MLRIAICDDDAVFVKKAAEMLNNWVEKPENAVFETFENGDELISAHKASPFDIILLDVVMPMINGIETAREIRSEDKNTKIVFLTSSPEFAVESYTVKANNYLLKPVSEKALFDCLDEFADEIIKKSRSITVKSIYTVHKILVDEIVYIEAQNKHIVLVLTDGTIITTTEPLNTLVSKLSEEYGFFRCHRSYIVNMKNIIAYTNKEITVRSGSRIPVSRSCHKEFEVAYFKTIFESAGDLQ